MGIKQWFCRHSNLKESGKYYSTQSDTVTDFWPKTYIFVYKIYTCLDCKKVITIQVLEKEFLGWNDNRSYQANLKEKGFCSYEEMVLEPGKYLKK